MMIDHNIATIILKVLQYVIIGCFVSVGIITGVTIILITHYILSIKKIRKNVQ